MITNYLLLGEIFKKKLRLKGHQLYNLSRFPRFYHLLKGHKLS
jgi:hypothetical protein